MKYALLAMELYGWGNVLGLSSKPAKLVAIRDTYEECIALTDIPIQFWHNGLPVPSGSATPYAPTWCIVPIKDEVWK